MDHYGGQNIVPYSATREYELVDFLPPKIQALVNRWLYTTTEMLPNMPPDWRGLRQSDETAVSIGMNCWHTAYEVIRDLGKPWKEMTGRLGGFGLPEARNLVGDGTTLNPEKFSLDRSLWENSVIPDDVGARDESTLLAIGKRAQRNANRAVGDMLEVDTRFAPNAPAHVALWIDDDLYFEKTNYGSDDPIRLAFYEDVVQPYFFQDDAAKPMTLTFVRWPSDKSLFPVQESFAGKDPYAKSRGGTTLSALPPDIANSVIFTLDAGSSGFPQLWAAYRVLTFPLVQNPTTGRVEMEGADKLLKFQTTSELCQVSKFYRPMPGEPVSPFGYKIDSALQLTVFNKTTGKTVATLNGKYVNRPFPTKSGRPHTAYVDFPAGDKTLSLVSGGVGSSYIVHPTVADDVTMSCEREPSTFNNLD
jgi:hypothetical protein